MHVFLIKDEKSPEKYKEIIKFKNQKEIWQQICIQ